ncbi:MAG: esterase [Phycisphaeraceae bacterium]|nr:esterase [Phycisphaeraceae bacterium]
MAFIQCDFGSDALGMACSMNVILPQKVNTQIGMKGVAGEGKHPTLFLLHGLSDDHTIWMRRTSIERYVAPLGLAVVMPNVHRSFYTDMAMGGKYWTFVSEELPRVARSLFHLSDKREDNFVAGLSMGGYGAMKMGLRKPEMFAAAASLSGVMDINSWINRMESEGPDRYAEFLRVFGDKDSELRKFGDLFDAAKEVQDSAGPKPALYQACGDADFLYDQNLKFRDHLKTIGYDAVYEEDAGYGHGWDYWDITIQRVLDWLPLQNRPQS